MSKDELEATLMLLGFTHFGSASRKKGRVRWLRKVGFDIKGGRITTCITPIERVQSIVVFSLSNGKMKFTHAEDAYKYILEVMNEQR